MQPKVQLSIPEPCHEDWHKMTPSQQGRFCSACAKEVVDFTAMSDTEVLHYFLDKKNENVCGRMFPDQLNRPVTKTIYTAKKKRWYWNMAALLLLLSKSAAVKAQGMIKVSEATRQKKDNAVQHPVVPGTITPGMSINKMVSGTITDAEGNPVSSASVTIKGTKNVVAADEEGNYRVRANTQQDILQVSAVGYELAELSLKNAKQYDIILQKSKTTLEDDVVVMVGGITSDYDYFPPAATKHMAVIEVLDNATRTPVKAVITIVKEDGDKTDTITTNTKGTCSLKRIKEADTYKLTVKADGYMETTLDIKGWTFNNRKERMFVFLERQPVPADYKKMDTVAVISYGTVQGKIAIGCGPAEGPQIVQLPAPKNIFADTLNTLRNLLAGPLKIAPNPVAKGNAFTLQYTVRARGRYLVQITNEAGQTVLQQEVDAQQKNNLVQVQTDAKWGSGVYFLRLTNANNTLAGTKSFIVQ